MRPVVVAAAADPEGRGQQSFLNVVADRAAGHAPAIRQFIDAESPVFLVHAGQYRQLLSRCQLSYYFPMNPGWIPRKSLREWFTSRTHSGSNFRSGGDFRSNILVIRVIMSI